MKPESIAAQSGENIDLTDQDPAETVEWQEAFEGAIRAGGHERGRFLLEQLEASARALGVVSRALPYSAYRNTIDLDHQPPFPGDLAMEERLSAMIRWNALAMVVKANQAYGELGGHIASFASAAEIFETGFNHFFQGPQSAQGPDLVFFQPHSAPGVYARAYLEGRLDEQDLAHYRQEIGAEAAGAKGLSSYPHPWLMPDFWQVPTGSMGLGPISAIYHARFMRYLEARNIAQTSERHVWGVFGDGEMDEPESMAGLTLAARERLDNLTFIVNCNLQRLDGPVRGNGQIIQELEALFNGAGWNVIKVLWGSDWDSLFARDRNHTLLRRFAATVDGKYQTLGAKDGAYNLANFFQEDPELAALVSHMSDQEVDALRRGGHDMRKLHAAFAAAKAHKGAPTVILAKTKKGFGMGGAGESRMTAHQAKKLDVAALLEYRDRFNLPLNDEQVESLAFVRPDESSAELRYLRERRHALGGFTPQRVGHAPAVELPPLSQWGAFALEPQAKSMSTTMAFVRCLSNLLRDKILGPKLVPIVADEARTFGMASLFRQVGIYSPDGQQYEPEDAESMLSYREATDGQLLEEGITEAGALASWTAAATAYSVHGQAMLPFYIYYSMFGFQRVGDQIWAAADQRARGFLIGATAGRTTLGGEGLQHQDGSSHLVASTVPNCRAWDPAFAGELAVIMAHGMQRMLGQNIDEFHYITVGNANYPQRDIPANKHADIVSGMYHMERLAGATGSGAGATSSADESAQVRLLGSGAIMTEVLAAAHELQDQWGVTVDLFSVTSYSELSRQAREAERQRWEQMSGEPVVSHVHEQLAGTVPVVAATDYVRGVPQQIAQYVAAPFYTLGTDGFGRSDNRARLREFFEVDASAIVRTALFALVRQGVLSELKVRERLPQAALSGAPAPWTI
ncbi:MAG: alpha-ketoglutarate dehydrogenase [Burkholderiaceae bacterium]